MSRFILRNTDGAAPCGGGLVLRNNSLPVTKRTASEPTSHMATRLLPAIVRFSAFVQSISTSATVWKMPVTRLLEAFWDSLLKIILLDRFSFLKKRFANRCEPYTYLIVEERLSNLINY